MMEGRLLYVAYTMRGDVIRHYFGQRSRTL